jgi:hypothetical protein
MNNLIFKWYGSGFDYGQKVKFFCLEIDQVELIFTIHKSTHLSDEPFLIERSTKKNVNTITTEHESGEVVSSIHLIKTDENFRKKFKRSYYLLKFITADQVFTIGAYSDSSSKMNAMNSYLLCTHEFINLLADSVVVTEPQQIMNTAFECLKCLFSKKELAIELLKTE